MTAELTKDTRFLMTTGIMLSPPLALAFEISGALIIQQLHYWLTISKHNHEGHTWVYNTYEKWVEHLKVYSDKTIRNKLKELEDLGIVVTGNFNKTKYDRTRWYRLDYATLLSVASERLPSWKLVPVSSGSHYQIIPVAAAKPIPKNTQEKTEEKSLVKASLHGGSAIKIKVPPESSIQEPPMPKQINSAKVLLAQLKESNGKPQATVAPNTTASLTRLWRHTVGAVHPSGGLVPEFTMAQRGQFSQIVRKLGKQSDKVVEYCIREWIGFTKYVANAAGVHKTPDLPSIGFVLKYAAEASAFTAQDQPSESKKPVQLIAPVKKKVVPVKVSLNETKDVASLDDVMSWKPGKE